MTDTELFEIILTGITTYKERYYEDSEKRAEERHPYEFPFEAYVTLAKDIEHEGKKINAGTKFRVRLASRLGDLCLTRNLQNGYGYEIRIEPGKGLLTDCHIVSMGKI